MAVYDRSGEAPAMCAEAKDLFVGYLDLLEEHDRLHLMFLAASRRNDPETTEAYRGLLGEARVKLHAVRGQFQDHQKAHNCFEVIHFEDDLNA